MRETCGGKGRSEPHGQTQERLLNLANEKWTSVNTAIEYVGRVEI